METNLILSDIEQVVYNWLTKRRIPFEAQVSLRGGVFELGGAKVDFILENDIALRVHGEYWHQRIGQRASDMVQREVLEADGFTVVDAWGDDLTPDRVDDTMEKALKGVEMLR